MKKFGRRVFVGAGVAALATQAHAVDPHFYEVDVRRDVGCGCCELWAQHLRENGPFTVTVSDAANMREYKESLGVPANLASCHTGVVNGYWVEGHVPAREIARLLRERPRNVRGLSVPGMPIGSPGMDAPSGRRDAYDVIAVRRDGTQFVFASYEAEGL